MELWNLHYRMAPPSQKKLVYSIDYIYIKIDGLNTLLVTYNGGWSSCNIHNIHKMWGHFFANKPMARWTIVAARSFSSAVVASAKRSGNKNATYGPRFHTF
jgi:hypothetical protein